MDIVALIGRILFSAIFLSSAYGHFAQTAAMTGYAESKKVPAARLAVLGGGVLLLLGGLMVLLGVWGDLGALFLVVFLVPTALLMHNFWAETDEQAKMMDMVQFFKDTGLAGASLLVFVLYATGDLGLTITDPLF